MLITTVKESYLKKINFKAFFSDEEMTYISSKQTESILARLALKISSSQNITIKNKPTGEPYLEGRKEYCSLSHSFGTGIATMSKKRVGIDIEKIRYHRPELLKFISSENERKLLSYKNADTSVTDIWAIKEAVLKAKGIGLSYPLRQIELNKVRDYFEVCISGETWYVKTKMIEDYVVALASEELAEIKNLNYKFYS